MAIRHLSGGRAEVLALVCQGHEVNGISVFEDRSEGGGARWAVAPALRGEPRKAERTHLLRVALFDVPDGWETEDKSLTHLAPDVPYGVSFSSVEGQRSEIGFELADLERLDGRVRTGPWMDEQTMNESDSAREVTMRARGNKYSVHVRGRNRIEYRDPERTVLLEAGMLDQAVYLGREKVVTGRLDPGQREEVIQRVYRHLNVVRQMGLEFINPDGSRWRPPPDASLGSAQLEPERARSGPVRRFLRAITGAGREGP